VSDVQEGGAIPRLSFSFMFRMEEGEIAD